MTGTSCNGHRFGGGGGGSRGFCTQFQWISLGKVRSSLLYDVLKQCALKSCDRFYS